MRIKKFTAHSLKDATHQMRIELGPEAIILNTRTVPRVNGRGLFGRDTCEVTAAIDDGDSAPKPGGTDRRQPSVPFTRYLESQHDPARAAQTKASPADEMTKVAEGFEARRGGSAPASRPVPQQAADVAGILDLRNEMETMRGTLRQISDHIRYSRMPELPEILRETYAHLIENDVEEEISRQLVQAIGGTLSRDQLSNKALVQEALLQAMAGMIRIPEASRMRRRKTRIVALVGPTGVGKTTTIAKMAAIQKLLHRKNVALISTDTYRIGAIEQLRTFAAIADIPMEVVYRPSEMAPAIRRFRDRDLLFIDTVGRSHRSRKEIAELGRFVEAADPDEVHLVLSASTAPKAAREIIARFKAAGPNRLLFTKLDEAVSLGSLLSLLHTQRLPVAYVTTGQTVPDDILTVESARFASMILAGAPAHA
jgi:flagellar biosynthesis protein FlhF